MNTHQKSRREFIKTTGTAMATGALAFNIGQAQAFSLNNKTLKVGLVGCGGRGTGAANQALTADPNVILTAVADVFPDRLEKSLKSLTEIHEKKIKVKDKRKYIGFDAYRELIDSDVDVVILTTPPAFRPDHLAYAVEKGKHVFCEKPMAVDMPGLKKVYAAARKAKENGTHLMGGFCWRYHFPKRAAFGQIGEGAIGDISAIYNTYNTGYLWEFPRKPEWGDMENKMRNWVYYNWLSGDHIMEQAIHSIDMMLWAMGDKMPIKAVGTGGRQRRVEDKYGNVFDHFGIVYEWENGVKGFHMSRQQKNTERAYHVEVMGTDGRLHVDCIRRRHEVTGKNPWKYDGEANNMYQTEHDELFAAIRGNGELINDGQYMCDSTLLALWGRMVAYTGQELTLEQVKGSTEILGPKIGEYDWGLDWPTADVAKPGITKFS